MKYGYARKSSVQQSLSIQVAALKEAGCDIVRQEQGSGTTRNGRSELAVLLEFMRDGDTLVVTRIDRLARSMRDLQNIVYELQQKGVTLTALEQPIDTSTSAGKAFLDMLGVFAEFESNLRFERQMEGVRAAQRAGKYQGRKASVDVAAVKELHQSGLGVSAIAKQLNIGRSSVYRSLEV